MGPCTVATRVLSDAGACAGDTADSSGMRPRGSSTTSVPRRPSSKKLNRVRVLTGTDAHTVADADAGADMGPDAAAVQGGEAP
jgi:hypothetical protein